MLNRPWKNRIIVYYKWKFLIKRTNNLLSCFGDFFCSYFFVLVKIGGRKGIALIDSGSTDTFMDYTFASKVNCSITTTATRQVKVVGGRIPKLKCYYPSYCVFHTK
jgi:hypothetical protein